MTFFSNNVKFWIKWLLLALIVFSLSFLRVPDTGKITPLPANSTKSSYSPYAVNHFTVGIKPTDFAFLFSDCPESLYSYQDAELVVNRTPVVYKTKMRIRGTHAWHWNPQKPSFRLRLRGQKKILERSNLNFINPDDASMLANLVADNVAINMGIPSARTTICTVTINNDYKGLYHLAETINPEALMTQGFTGANVIEGNMRDSKMWKHPELWEIQSNTPENISGPFNCLSRLLAMIETPVQLSRIENLAELIMTDRLASWSALMTAIGSIHSNDFFGNILVHDQLTDQLFPAISDSTGFGVLTSLAGQHSETDIKIPPYEFLTPLLNAFFRVPEFQFQRNLALYKLLNGDLHPDNLGKVVDQFLAILKPLYYKEPYASALLNVPILHFPQKLPVSPEVQIADALRLLDFMKARREFLLGLLNKADAMIVCTPQKSEIGGKWYRHQVIQVSGHCPIEWDFSAFSQKILPDFDFDGILDGEIAEFYGLQRLYPGLKESQSDLSEQLMLKTRWSGFILEPDAQSYVLGISEEHLDECLNFLKNHGKNAITGEKAGITYASAPASVAYPVQKNPAVLHPWRNLKNGKN